MSLKLRLLILFLAVSLIPIFLIGTISAKISSDIVLSWEIKGKGRNLEEIQRKVDKILKEKQLVGIDVLLDRNVQTLLEAEESFDESTQKRLEFEVKKLLLDYKNVYGTKSLNLYGHNGMTFSNIDTPALSGNKYSLKDWYKKGRKEASYFWGNIEWIGGEAVIPFVRIIRKLKEPEEIGFFVLNLKESYLRSTFIEAEQADVGTYCITNQYGTIISHHNSNYLGKQIDEIYSLDELPGEGEEGYTHGEFNGARQLMVYLRDAVTGWQYLSIVPYSEIMKGVRYIRVSTFGLSLVSIFICFLFSLLLSRMIIHPINNLIGQMEKAQTGDLDIRIIHRHKGEIGKLEESFDIMIGKLKKSINDIIAIQREKREAELKFLEFQINPHFLYNTLSSIIWLSNAGKNDEVIRLTQSLSDLFRISISKGKEVIRIEDELKHVRSFLEIEGLRYPGEFVVVYDIDKDLLSYYTIKLIMQPIVENAVYHGVKKREDGRGEIRIQGALEEGNILLRVLDNGTALDDEEINAINAFLEDEQCRNKHNYGIGIRNVHDRIRLHYGKEYGILFKKEGSYTVVELRIPVLKEPYEYL